MSADTLETVYQFIHSYITEQRCAPTQQEIAVGCYIAKSTVARYLDRLMALGRISYRPHRARSIVLLCLLP